MTITCTRSRSQKGRPHAVKGFWSLTLYNDRRLFNADPLKALLARHENKKLQYNADSSLTLYAGATSPGGEKESNWLPAPAGTLSLFIRAYWAEEVVLDGTWTPPIIEIAN